MKKRKLRIPKISQSETFSPNDDNANCRESVAAAPAQSGLSPFDPPNLRLDPEYLKSGGVKKLLTTVPVRRPNKQDFVRVHPDPEYRLCGVAIIEFREDRESYLVMPSYAQGLDPQLFNCCNLNLAINRQKVLFLWPTKLPTPGGHVNAWHSSGLEAAEKAMTHWIRVVPNTSLGAYEFFVAESHLSDPEWPSLSLRDLIEIAFKDRIVKDRDHPAMQKLRGAI
jgi:hypothetical protein